LYLYWRCTLKGWVLFKFPGEYTPTCNYKFLIHICKHYWLSLWYKLYTLYLIWYIIIYIKFLNSYFFYLFFNPIFIPLIINLLPGDFLILNSLNHWKHWSYKFVYICEFLYHHYICYHFLLIKFLNLLNSLKNIENLKIYYDIF
jgi:hypothetical protein